MRRTLAWASETSVRDLRDTCILLLLIEFSEASVRDLRDLNQRPKHD